MALILLNNSGIPFSFDGYDGLAATMLGGEVATLVSYDVTGSDKHASDVNDGYVQNNAGGGLQTLRPIVTTDFSGASGATGSSRPLFLTDDGTSSDNSGSGYGTLFGTLVGGSTGQVVTGGTKLGPPTMSGSGKVTLWMNPGLYGITLDALDATLAASTSVTVGTQLFFTTAGKICLTGQNNSSSPCVGRVVEFSTGDTLVTTPRSLTRVSLAGGKLQFKYMVMTWNPPVS